MCCPVRLNFLFLRCAGIELTKFPNAGSRPPTQPPGPLAGPAFGSPPAACQDIYVARRQTWLVPRSTDPAVRSARPAQRSLPRPSARQPLCRFPAGYAQASACPGGPVLAWRAGGGGTRTRQAGTAAGPTVGRALEAGHHLPRPLGGELIRLPGMRSPAACARHSSSSAINLPRFLVPPGVGRRRIFVSSAADEIRCSLSADPAQPGTSPVTPLAPGPPGRGTPPGGRLLSRPGELAAPSRTGPALLVEPAGRAPPCK